MTAAPAGVRNRRHDTAAMALQIGFLPRHLGTAKVPGRYLFPNAFPKFQQLRAVLRVGTSGAELGHNGMLRCGRHSRRHLKSLLRQRLAKLRQRIVKGPVAKGHHRDSGRVPSF